MMSLATVGAPVLHLFLCLVALETDVRLVTSAAYSAHWLPSAGSLVMTESLAPKASERLGRVGTDVKSPPIAEVYMRRERSSEGDKDLSCFLLVAGGLAARRFLYLWVPQ